MATKKVVSTKYVDLISKTSQDVEKEMLDLNVEQAQNTLDQGSLSVKSQLLAEQGKVKTAQISVGNMERSLSLTKSAQPFNVQSVLNARKNLLVAQQEVESAKAELQQVQEAYDFLVALKEELF